MEGFGLEQPQGSREMLVYGLMVRMWGHIVLDAVEANAFILAKTLGVVHQIPPARMLELNWSAYREVNEIATFEYIIQDTLHN